jgi:probable FeS assembly SUF system protein SufT
MTQDKAIVLKRDCDAVMVPSGDGISLKSGSSVWITQTLGNSYTVMTDHGHMVRIDGEDAAALGLPVTTESANQDSAAVRSLEDAKTRVWDKLKNCFDPEIPVNIVDLGLIYDCNVTALSADRYRAEVRFTLTAQGCGMGQFLRADIRQKLLTIPGIDEADVELIWEPPWSQSRMSGAAKLQLGIE